MTSLTQKSPLKQHTKGALNPGYTPTQGGGFIDLLVKFIIFILRTFWPYRVELSLFFVIAVVQLYVYILLGEYGFYASSVIIAFALYRLRSRLLFIFTSRSLLRKWAKTCHTLGLLSPHGFYPRIVSITKKLYGYQFMVNVPAGMHLDDLVKIAPRLAVALRVREVQITPRLHTSHVVVMNVVRLDPFVKMGTLRSPLLDSYITQPNVPIAIGKTGEGKTISIDSSQSHTIVTGMTGSGKSVAFQSIVATFALQPKTELYILDGNEVQGIFWADRCERFSGADPKAALEFFEHLYQVMLDRLAFMTYNRLVDLSGNEKFPLIVVAVDEWASFCHLPGPEGKRLMFLMQNLTARCRAVGMRLFFFTQRLTADLIPVPVRANVLNRVAFRADSDVSSDIALGGDWSEKGYNAWCMPSSVAGVGYVHGQGYRNPQLFRSFYLSPSDVETLALRAIGQRKLYLSDSADQKARSVDESQVRRSPVGHISKEVAKVIKFKKAA